MTNRPSVLDAVYLEHFTATDLALLSPDGRNVPPVASRSQLLAGLNGSFDEILRSDRTFEVVFHSPEADDPLLFASPFLVFSVAVHRSAQQLETASYVSEWLGLNRRAPVFDVANLREFMADAWHRLFLTELLASYTHVTSGSVVVRTSRGVRRHRFSELDPVRLAGVLDVVSDVERPGVLRRLGDLALFLTGVFPDYVARTGFGPIDEGRLLRAGGRSSSHAQRPNVLQRPQETFDRGAVGLLEQLGRRWYQGAFELLPRPIADNVAVLGELPTRFDQARRLLGYITEQFVLPNRSRWFGISGP